jgi:hypothetical protein
MERNPCITKHKPQKRACTEGVLCRGWSVERHLLHSDQTSIKFYRLQTKNSTHRPHANLSRYLIVFHNSYMPLWHNTSVSYLTVRDSSWKMFTLQNKIKYRMDLVAYRSNAKTLLVRDNMASVRNGGGPLYTSPPRPSWTAARYR